MNENETVAPPRVETERVHAKWRQLDRRQWWLWSSTIAVLLLLTICVGSFSFPGLFHAEAEQSFIEYLNQSVRALVAIVLIFSLYLIYQQTMIFRMRDQMADQLRSITKVENLTNEVYKLAALDPLTGLYNRRSGEQRLTEEMQRAARHGRPLTALLLDLDGLKIINDEWGHAAGDAMLRGFSDRLLKAIRGSDLAARLGGDEFMVLLPECRSDEVRHVLARLEGLEVDYMGKKIPCRFSRGWTDFRLGETSEEFLKRADETLYANKRAGKADRRAPLKAVPSVS